jgi:hypothetical protein
MLKEKQFDASTHAVFCKKNIWRFLLAMLFSGGLVAGLYIYLVQHVAATDIAAHARVFMVSAVLQGLFWMRIGYAYSGYDDLRQRHLWSAADLAWIALALFSFGKILLPVENVVLTSAAQRDQGFDQRQHTIQLNAIWKAQDALCAGGKLDVANAPQCDALRRAERAAVLMQQAQPFALRVGRELGQFCANTSCDAPVQAVIVASTQVKQAFAERDAQQRRMAAADIDVSQPTPQDPEETVKWAYIQVLMLTLAFGLRCGRTAAEVRRNQLDARKKAGPATSTPALVPAQS